MLKVNNLTKQFNKQTVLNEVSFEVNKGEIVTLLGQSGAGKTTILRCINGLENFDGGSIEIDGQMIKSKKDLLKVRKNVGLVFQNYNLFPHKTVIENIIEAPTLVLGMNKEEAKKRAIDLLKQVGLSDKANSLPNELSGGQQQRVAIARACALEPKILCFDEPTSALDPELTNGIAEIMKKLAKEGMSILVITHDMEFANNVSTRTLLVKEGKVLESA
ncbi:MULTISPECIES: amino acid ABC transporter ATP-binding protein [unclassified Bacillus (in: firmicutes)]|uniref:amino acid ABC transporter ATP-binding protein n=1 Tax=unclassified Bacillus (in: firmicutes) TaxID=185979 RepID=UPI00040018B1|nr:MULTISPECIES: amino acid ABC transporter ATP-binding protein [unclassified Bacillus (in: firmicutes)]PGZ91778.1 amino acid ABC transporter ATP-binding protein [Bacillus sp. AFS029533]SFD08505.1 polar amino acid transport system ATP-binding protein [Bacillus sp. UNCCL81]